MNKWQQRNNGNGSVLLSSHGMENFLLDYHQLLPFMMSPPEAAMAAARTTPATAANSPPMLIPSLFGASPNGPYLHWPPTAAAAAAAAVAGPQVPAQHRKLFIGGLNHETTDEELREYYSQWGQVVDCIVIRDPITRHSRGFGFVTFATIEMADAAMAVRPHMVGGKIVDPKRAIPREQMLQAMNSSPPSFLETEPPSECKLLLSGINWNHHGVNVLRQYFEHFGEVQQVECHSKGHGFVVFDERGSVERCLAHKPHIVNGLTIEAKPDLTDYCMKTRPIQSGCPNN